MENKKLKNKGVKPQESLSSRDRKRKSNVNVPFDENSYSEYSWWDRLLIKTSLSHKNKFIDRIADIGCLLTILIIIGVIIFVAKWICNLLQQFIY